MSIFNKFLNFFNYLFFSFLMIITFLCSFVEPVNYFSDALASHMESHGEIHKKGDVSFDEPELGHTHKHRHSDNEEEHTHKHLNVINFSGIVLNQSVTFYMFPYEIKEVLPQANNLSMLDSYFLEILKPPIS
jgi:hypothetical protein